MIFNYSLFPSPPQKVTSIHTSNQILIHTIPLYPKELLSSSHNLVFPQIPNSMRIPINILFILKLKKIKENKKKIENLANFHKVFQLILIASYLICINAFLISY